MTDQDRRDLALHFLDRARAANAERVLHMLDGETEAAALHDGRCWSLCYAAQEAEPGRWNASNEYAQIVNPMPADPEPRISSALWPDRDGD